MRSIRQSLTLYLFALLAVTLAVVWFVIDQVTARTLAAREQAGANLLRSQYEERCREERARVDEALLRRAKLLGNLMGLHYQPLVEAEFTNYRRLVEGLHLLVAASPFQEHIAPLDVITRPGPSILARSYFANLPLPEEIIRHFDEESRDEDFSQINTVSGREWRSHSLDTWKLPFDAKEIDSKPGEAGKPGETPNLIDWVFRESTLAPNGEAVRRVLYKAPLYTRGRGYRQPGPGGPPGRSMLGGWGSFVTTFGYPPPSPGPSIPNPDSLPRLYIQCARPQAAIDLAITRFAAERDNDLAALATEITEARVKLRFDLTTIALVAFLGLAIGAPILVSRGLRPVGKLSDAVSRVSEKDFKLTYDGNNLAVELAPIHARLTQTLDLLRRAFSREKQAVADISHELRTPIAALMATIDVALRKPRTPEQYREALEECRLISKQLGQLVERIMTLASLDSGNDRLLLSRTDASELASGCVAVIRPLAAANGVTVEVNSEEMLDIETDAGKLREVVMNLLHNAIEYNKPDGSIQLTVRRVADTVVFEVRDTGIGMTPEVKDKIFERFYRADPSRHSTGVHAGLGLAIVKEYVVRLNGTITVESEAGSGSTFRVTLPAPVPQLGEPGEARPADVPVTAGF